MPKTKSEHISTAECIRYRKRAQCREQAAEIDLLKLQRETCHADCKHVAEIASLKERLVPADFFSTEVASLRCRVPLDCRKEADELTDVVMAEHHKLNEEIAKLKQQLAEAKAELKQWKNSNFNELLTENKSLHKQLTALQAQVAGLRDGLDKIKTFEYDLASIGNGVPDPYIMRIITQALAEKGASPWIPVTPETMPEKNHLVLVLVQCDDGIEPDTWCYRGVLNSRVLYWMPIPTLPASEGGE